MAKQVRVGICGLGTVGGGVFNVLERNADEISMRIGADLVVSHVGARRDRDDIDTSNVKVSRDIFDVAKDPDVDILVETIGGYDVAKELILTAIDNGKHVVTANKALIAEHGNEIFAAAQAKGVDVLFEAAVAGGIPVIKALREGLSANKINWLAGIINGTGNFILTEMKDKGRDFADVLKEAQELGYAEADPTFDVEGIDAAHKLMILACLAFGMPFDFSKVYTEGISKLDLEDIEYADSLGYYVKHLGIAKRTEKGIEIRVHPTLLPKSALIANVNGVMNAVMIHGDAVGPTLFYGPGAGAEPTASSVIADVIDVARGLLNESAGSAVPAMSFSQITEQTVLPIDQVQSAYYLRLSADDKPGVLSQVAQQLSDQGISIEAMIQKEPKASQTQATIVLLTNITQELQLDQAINNIEALASIHGAIVKIRVDNLS